MKYEILATARFKKDLMTVIKRGYNIKLLQDIGFPAGVRQLFTGEKQGSCAVRQLDRAQRVPYYSRLLLVYRINSDILVLTLTRTGTHSDLFQLYAI